MKVRHNTLEIPADKPFQNCKLKRQKYAEILTSIVGSYSDGFVMSVNNEWGAGKTTFVKMWQQLLKNKGFETLYFNAWENDFDSNPLVALMSELKSLTKDNDKTYKSLLQKGAIFTKNIVPALLKGLAKKYFDEEIIIDAVENTADAAEEILKNEIDKYAEKKKGLVEFKAALEKFVAEHNSGKPLIFFIDELDRCRPDYSVEVLEQVKHFFTVPGIVFVLALDKTQLSHAIRGVYGSELFNADEYLKRFIDLEYQLPKPNNADYCHYLISYFQYDDFFSSGMRGKMFDFAQDPYSFLKTSIALLQNQNLRQIEKLLSTTRIILRTFYVENFVFPELLLGLAFIKTVNPELYYQIKNSSLSLNELLVDLMKTIPAVNEGNRQQFIRLESEIAYRYSDYLKKGSGARLIRSAGGELSLEYSSQFDNSIKKIESITLIEQYRTHFNTRDLPINYLFEKIDLCEDLIS